MARAQRTDRRGRVRRSPFRYLVPIFLAAAVAGTYVIVHDNLKSKHHPTKPHTTTTHRTSSARTKAAPRPTFYIVQPGDSMTSIAAKTGVSLGTLQALNPSVDPNTLQTGQRLRLRR